MKKFKWVSAVTSILMAAALAVTGCSSDGGSSAPADSRLSLSRYIAETAPDAEGYIDLNAADIDSKVIFGDAEITKSVKIKNLKCGSGNSREAAPEEQKSLTNVITFKVKANGVEFKNVDGVKIVMESGTLKLEDSKALALSVTGTSAVKTESSGKDVEIPTVDIKAESGADIAVPAGELNVSKEVKNLTISGGEVKKLSIAQKSDTEQASLNVSGASTKINDIEVKSAAGTVVANKTIDISFGNGATAETLYVNVENADLKAALTAATKEWEITGIKFVRPERELKQSIFKGSDIDLTGFSLKITKTVKGGTDTKDEIVPMTAANSQTANVTPGQENGKVYISLNLKYKGSDTILEDESGSSEVKLELTGTEKLYPQPFASTPAFEDTDLVLTFDAAPVVNRTIDAKVAVKNGSTTVDEIAAKDETLRSIVNNAAATINVKDNMITVDGNKVIIKIHAADDVKLGSKLELDKEYSVELPKGLISGTIDGVTIDELKNVWKFKTRVSAPSISANTIQVGGENAQFASVQGAFNYIMRTASTSDASSWTVNVAEGTYYERLSFTNQKASVKLTGANTGDATGSNASEKTVIRWTNLNSYNGNTRSRPLFLWEGADLDLRNITLKNTADRSVEKVSEAQAEAIYFDSKNNFTAFNCFFRSHQDTILVGNNGGKCWFYKSYIEGDTDYIWGTADVCLVEECVLHCIRDTYVSSQKSYLLECRTVATNNTVPKGFVIFNSKIKVDSGVTAYYGRDASKGACTQGAVVNNEFTGTVNADLWGHCGNKAIHAFDQAGVCAVGYKAFNNKINGAVNNSASTLADTYALTALINEREFNGRRAIFNRVFNKTTKAYEAASSKWDLSSFETEFGATEDASKNNLFVEPLYTVDLPKGESSNVFTAKNIDGTDVDFELDGLTVGTFASNRLTVSSDAQTGTHLLKAVSEGKSGRFQVGIIAEYIPLTSIAISGIADNAEIVLDDVIQLSPLYVPASPTAKEVTWTSTPAGIVEIDESGKLIAKSAGTATITLNGGREEKGDAKSSSITVRVSHIGKVSYLTDTSSYSAKPAVNRFNGEVDNAVRVSDLKAYRVNGSPIEVTPAVNSGWIRIGGDFNSAITADVAYFEFTVANTTTQPLVLKAISATLNQNASGKIGPVVRVNGEIKNTLIQSKTECFNKQSLGNVSLAEGQSATIRVGFNGIDTAVAKNTNFDAKDIILYYEGAYGTGSAETQMKGESYNWDFVNKNTPIELSNGICTVNYSGANQSHGALFQTNDTVAIKVVEPVKVTFIGCQYGSGPTNFTVTNTAGTNLGTVSVAKNTDCAAESGTFLYKVDEKTTLTFKATANGGWIHGIKVVPYTPTGDEPVEALWDFQNGSPESIKTTSIQEGNKGSVPSNVDGISLSVDATTGKLESRTSDAQFNAGAVIKVPVTKDAKITVTSYPNYHNYTVAGTAADADTVTYTATAADAANGFIEIVATNTSYLYSIKAVYVTAPAGSGGSSNPYFVEKFTIADPATEVGPQGVKDGNPDGWNAPAEPKKIDFASGVSVQFSADTKYANNAYIEVPVAGNCLIDVWFDSNKVPSTDCRTLNAEVSSGSGSVVVKDTASAYLDIQAETARVKRIVTFAYTGTAGKVKIEVVGKKEDGTFNAAKGAVYIYGVEVKASE